MAQTRGITGVPFTILNSKPHVREWRDRRSHIQLADGSARVVPRRQARHLGRPRDGDFPGRVQEGCQRRYPGLSARRGNPDRRPGHSGKGAGTMTTSEPSLPWRNRNQN